MRRQHGLTTLLVTTMVLVVSLLFSLASYKNLFYQIKRAQNEVLARKAHWLAEGGLECGFTLNKINSGVKASEQDYATCNSLFLSVTADDIDSNRAKLKSEYKNKAYSVAYKEFVSNLRTTGAIQARSNLKLIGDFDIYPDVSGAKVNNQYQCIAVRYSGEVFYEKAVSSVELEVLDPKDNGPYSGFSGTCLDSHRSNITVVANTVDSPPDGDSTLFKSDFVKDTSFEPFESFFGKKRSDIADVRSEFIQIDGSILASGETCDKKASDAFQLGNKVWVTGSCDLLNAHYINNLPEASRVLVVENGVLATHSSTRFAGMIYHLISTPISNMTNAWAGVTSADTMDPTDKVKGVYYQAGSFVADGGFVFDTPGGLSVIKGSMSFSFVGERNPLPPSNDIHWVEGSWHDF